MERAYSHSGIRPSCAFISRIVLPVWLVSNLAKSGIRSARSRARFERTLERCMAGAFDHTPDSKTDWALWIVLLTASGDAHSTLWYSGSVLWFVARWKFEELTGKDFLHLQDYRQWFYISQFNCMLASLTLNEIHQLLSVVSLSQVDATQKWRYFGAILSLVGYGSLI